MNPLFIILPLIFGAVAALYLSSLYRFWRRRRDAGTCWQRLISGPAFTNDPSMEYVTERLRAHGVKTPAQLISLALRSPEVTDLLGRPASDAKSPDWQYRLAVEVRNQLLHEIAVQTVVPENQESLETLADAAFKHNLEHARQPMAAMPDDLGRVLTSFTEKEAERVRAQQAVRHSERGRAQQIARDSEILLIEWRRLANTIADEFNPHLLRHKVVLKFLDFSGNGKIGDSFSLLASPGDGGNYASKNRGYVPELQFLLTDLNEVEIAFFHPHFGEPCRIAIDDPMHYERIRSLILKFIGVALQAVAQATGDMTEPMIHAHSSTISPAPP